jgi:heme exporter protein B
MPLAFLVITITLLPLTVGSALPQLQALAPGYIILTLALSTLLGLENIFARELDSGALDLFAPGPLPLSMTVVVLLAAHVLATGVPLVLAAPFLGILLGVSSFKAVAFMLPAMLAAVAFAMVGAIGAALSVLSRRSGLLMAVIALPLYVPIAIFASAAASGQRGALHLLGAYTLFAGALSPFAAAAALKLARE